MLLAYWNLFLIGVLCAGCNGLQQGDDLYSSIAALESVLNTEKSLIDTLAGYIVGSEEKINFVKSYLDDLKKDHTKNVEDGSTGRTIEDPLHSFLIKKRLSIGIPNLQDYLHTTTDEMTANFTKVQSEHDVPGNSDLNGVTLGLLRVQEVYEVSAQELADGLMKDINFGRKFSASDCIEIFLKLKDMAPYYAIDWLKVALKRIEQDGWKGITPQMNEILLLDFLAYTQFKEGSIENAKQAVESSLRALNKDFTDRNAIHVAENLKAYIENYIALKNGLKQPTASIPPVGALARHDLEELDRLKRGCRGELKKSPAEERKLFCKYETNNIPFCKLAPFKVEVKNLKPYLVVVHDVLYDPEIELLKNLSEEKLIRAGVWNQEKGLGEPSNARTSKFAWFKNDSHPIFPKLNQRVADITGLTMDTAEDFQLMNYGIGGHYDIHPDYFTEPTPDNDAQPYGMFENGNRLATVLFYMSDVPHGGGTVWPSINVLTLPKKGAAAFWFNLFDDGEPIYNARHAACPIIYGSKWVMNKWIRIRGQEFLNPCKTYPDHLRDS